MRILQSEVLRDTLQTQHVVSLPLSQYGKFGQEV